MARLSTCTFVIVKLLFRSATTAVENQRSWKGTDQQQKMHCSVIPSKKTPEQSEEIGVDQGHVGGGEEGEGEVPHDLLHLLLLVVPVRKASTVWKVELNLPGLRKMSIRGSSSSWPVVSLFLKIYSYIEKIPK